MGIFFRTALAAVLACSLALPLRAQDGGYGAESAEGEEQAAAPVQVEYLDEETAKLKDAVADPFSSNTDIYSRARTLFEFAMPRKESSAIGALEVRPWDKPDLEKNETSVSGLYTRAEEVLIRSYSEYREPPEPVVDAYLYGEGMRISGKAGYDEEEEKLSGNQVGAYVYTATEAVGILFNKAFKAVQRALGNGFAAATALHEGAHAADDAGGNLNPVEVRKGELHAFRTEYEYLRLLDPRGEKLAWAHYNYCGPDGQGEGYVCKYLKHLTKILYYGERDDFETLLDELGYQDRDHDPFQDHPRG